MSEEKNTKRGTYDTEKRNILVRTRLTEEEKNVFDKRVEQANLSQSEFIRQAILNSKIKAAPVKKGVDLKVEGELLYELSKIGTNLNQIARYYNYGEPRTADVDFQLRKTLTQLVNLQSHIAKKVGEKNGNTET